MEQRKRAIHKRAVPGIWVKLARAASCKKRITIVIVVLVPHFAMTRETVLTEARCATIIALDSVSQMCRARSRARARVALVAR